MSLFVFDPFELLYKAINKVSLSFFLCLRDPVFTLQTTLQTSLKTKKRFMLRCKAVLVVKRLLRAMLTFTLLMVCVEISFIGWF